MKKAEIAGVVKDFAPVIREYVAEAVKPLQEQSAAMERRMAALEAREPRHGSDGVGVTGAMIDRGGVLILTLSDGSTHKPGVVVGRDGEPGAPGKDGEDGKDGKRGEPGESGKDADTEAIEAALKKEVVAEVARAVSEIEPVKGDPGEPGRDVDMDAVAAMVGKAVTDEVKVAVAAIDPPKGDPGEPGQPGEKGEPGKDGADGIGFDDLEEVLSDDGRLIIRRYKRGSEVKEFHHRVPALIDRGVYTEEREYAVGDVVTWAGSLWICQALTAQKPGQADTWRLAVKRGRDGKDAPPATKGKGDKSGDKDDDGK